MWRYNFLSESQVSLLKKGIIDLGGEVDEEMARYVREALVLLYARAESTDVRVLITSKGGSVDYGLDIYDALRLYPGKKTGIVHGYAMSMGSLILQACDTRLCTEHAHVLIHHISRRSVSLDTMRSRKKIEEEKQELEAQQQCLYKILSARTNKSIAEIRRCCVRDTPMTAKEALEFGLIDKVI